MKNIGDYQKMADPYIPVSCAEGVDKNKIYGTWRSTSKKFNYKDRFTRLTLTPKGACFFESIVDGKVWKKGAVVKFNLYSTNNALMIGTNERKFAILKLTDSCLTIKWANGIIEYNRL